MNCNEKEESEIIKEALWDIPCNGVLIAVYIPKGKVPGLKEIYYKRPKSAKEKKWLYES